MLPINLAGTFFWINGCTSKPSSTLVLTLPIRPISFRSKTRAVMANIRDRAIRHHRKFRVVGVVRSLWSGRQAINEMLDLVAMEEKRLTF
jgi:hypothetical protein